ncbi:MAG TPA: DUF4339 domain-containing protein [Gemmataceae bacterium]|nr:DUF4339 domain-containing protein [Gemmataceae bacterium]
MSPLNFYLVIDGERKGPFALEELAANGLEHDTLVWHSGLRYWVRADQMPALRELLLTIPPPVPEELLQDREPPNYTPASFQGPYRWWVVLLVMALLLPLLGGLLLLTAQSEQVPTTYTHTDGRVYTYYRYTPLGELLRLLGWGLIGAGALPLIAALVLASILLYRVWNLIQDGHARTPPDKAVAFLCIPGFNFYWVFVAVHGLTLDLARYPRRHGGPFDLILPSPGLALIFCILFIACFVPFLQIAALLPALVAFILLVTSLKNAALALLAFRGRVDPLPTEEADPTGIVEYHPSPEGP